MRGQLEGKFVCRRRLCAGGVYVLAGGARGRIRARHPHMERDITGAQEARRLTQRRDERGFDSFKFRIATECGHDIDPWPGRTEDIVKRLRAP